MKASLRLVGLFSAFVGMGLSLGLPLSAEYGNPALYQTESARTAIYENVYNSDNVAHEAGDVVVWKDGTLADGLEISTTTTANNSLVAGVVKYGTTCAATSWCTIQIRGYHPTVTVGTVSVGDALVTGTTGEQAEAYTLVQATGALTGQATSYGVFGIVFGAASGGVAPAIILR